MICGIAGYFGGATPYFVIVGKGLGCRRLRDALRSRLTGEFNMPPNMTPLDTRSCEQRHTARAE